MTLAGIMMGAIILIAYTFGRVTFYSGRGPAAVVVARCRRRAGRHLPRRDPLRHPRADRGAAFLLRLLAPPRVPGGREFRHVHALPGRARLRAREDRAQRRPDEQRQPRRRADVRRQSAPGRGAFQPLQHASADGGPRPHPALDGRRRAGRLREGVLQRARRRDCSAARRSRRRPKFRLVRRAPRRRRSRSGRRARRWTCSTGRTGSSSSPAPAA